MLSGSRNNLQIINTSNVLKGNVSPSLPSLPSPSALPQNTGFRVKSTGRGSVSSVENPGGGKKKAITTLFDPYAPYTKNTRRLVPRPMFTAKRTNSSKVLQQLNNPNRFAPFNPKLGKNPVYPGWQEGGRSRRRTRHTHRKRRSLRRQSHRQRSRRVQRR